MPPYLSKTALPQHHEEIEVGEFHSVKVVGKLPPLVRRTDDFVPSGAELGFLNNKHTVKAISHFSQGKTGNVVD